MPSFVYGAHDYVEDGSGSDEGQDVVRLRYEEGARPGGDGSLRRWSNDREEGRRMHFEAIVVNQTSISFYQDAAFVASHPLRRPVTDCSGFALEVGAANARMGEVTVYARGLKAQELEEVIEYGATLGNVATGKKVYAPTVSDFDKLSSQQANDISEIKSLIAASQRLSNSDAGARVNPNPNPNLNPNPNPGPNPNLDPNPPVFTRASIEAGEASTSAAPPLVEGSNCTDGAWPTCHLMPAPTLEADPLDPSRSFYRLSPAAPATLFDASKDFSTARHYDPTTFPSWRGSSATFSAWVKAEASGYMITKSSDYSQAARCWTFHLEKNGLANIGGATVDGFTSPFKTVYLPDDAGFTFTGMDGFRHVALVFDALNDALTGYVDGASIGTAYFESGEVGKLDCVNGEKTYIGIGHRAPGGGPFVGEIADVRMYANQALSASEIGQIAFEEGAPRSCATSTEGADNADFVDEHGRGCMWYESERMHVPSICKTEDVRENCKLACGLSQPCLVAEMETNVPVYSLYNKVEQIVTRVTGEGVLCASPNLDVVDKCLGWRAGGAAPWPASLFWDWESYDSYRAYLAGESMTTLPNISDCELVKQLVAPYCEFTSSLPPMLDADALAESGWTISLWIKPSDINSYNSASEFAPTIGAHDTHTPTTPALTNPTLAPPSRHLLRFLLQHRAGGAARGDLRAHIGHRLRRVLWPLQRERLHRA